MRGLLLSAAVVALAGCAGERPASLPGSEGAVDACALFTDAELTDVLGEFERERGGGGYCSWVTPEHTSVSVDIGSPGTAPGGVVPEDEVMGAGEKGPDGITYFSGGYTTFAVGDRACHLQVVVSVTDTQHDRPAINRFVALVRERL